MMRSLSRILVAIVLLASCSRPDVLTMFVGTYSDGFYAYEFDQNAGEVVGEGPVAKAEMPNPSYLAVQGNRVYAVSEMPDTSASVWAWRWGGNGFEPIGSRPTGLPAVSGSVIPSGGSSVIPSEGSSVIPSEAKESPFRGEDPCYVSTDGHFLAVANYSGGTLATYRLREDGSIGPMDTLVVSGTGGPDMTRQDRPHVHCAIFTPDGKHLLFSEFSADEIGRMDIGPDGIRNYCRAATLHADYGPRHLLFDASGTHLYVIGELSGDITVFDYVAGTLTERQVIKADRLDARGAADIHISPDGRFLYASLRLRGDGISVFEVGADGTLTYVGYQATGIHPRNFNITPNGRFVLVACRDTDAIEIYARSSETGLLTFTGRVIPVSRPVFVGW
ncbi:MAG: lactonase family protein [Bacteroidales bacterium]|nr:lactonase family protein [Bacteroidales bacterium]